MPEVESSKPAPEPLNYAGARTHETGRKLIRLLLLLFVLCLIAAALYTLFFTSYGQEVRDDPHKAGRDFRSWVDRHRLIAPSILVLLYVLGSLSLMPVWWLQILSGYAWGLGTGLAWSLVLFAALLKKTPEESTAPCESCMTQLLTKQEETPLMKIACAASF